MASGVPGPQRISQDRGLGASRPKGGCPGRASTRPSPLPAAPVPQQAPSLLSLKQGPHRRDAAAVHGARSDTRVTKARLPCDGRGSSPVTPLLAWASSVRASGSTRPRLFPPRLWQGAHGQGRGPLCRLPRDRKAGDNLWSLRGAAWDDGPAPVCTGCGRQREDGDSTGDEEGPRGRCVHSVTRGRRPLEPRRAQAVAAQGQDKTRKTGKAATGLRLLGREQTLLL